MKAMKAKSIAAAVAEILCDTGGDRDSRYPKRLMPTSAEPWSLSSERVTPHIALVLVTSAP